MADDAFRIDDVLTAIDRTGPVPLYYQLASAMEQAVRAGTIPSGARLENEIAIAQRLGLSRPTVRRAMEELVGKGLLVRRRGIGTQVVQGQVTRQVELTSLYEDLKGTHHEPGTQVLALGTCSADSDVADALHVPAGAEVVYMRRLRSTDGVPVAILANHLPIEYVDITPEQLEARGLYEILRARGVTVRVANQRIGARRAHDDEGALLSIDRDGPVLTMERVAFDGSGRAVELGRHCYRPDLYSFETTLVAK